MTEHLPECWAKHDSDPEAWCQCEILRACEERVSGEFLTSAALAVTGMSDPRYAKGYTDALDAARKSVAALPQYAMRDTCVSAIEQLREERK